MCYYTPLTGLKYCIVSHINPPPPWYIFDCFVSWKIDAFIKCNMEIYQNSHQAVCFCAIIVNLQTKNLLWKLDKIHLGDMERVENKDNCFQLKEIVSTLGIVWLRSLSSCFLTIYQYTCNSLYTLVVCW